LISCQKDPYECGNQKLPEITKIGAGTFGFLINDEVWISFNNRYGITGPEIRTKYDTTYNILSINAVLISEFSKNDGWISISFKSDTTGILDQLTKEPFTQAETSNIYCSSFKTVPNEKAVVEIIKFDKINRIVSGKFDLRILIDECDKDSITINEGRFDLKF
jgi:hypothetical protein